MARGRSSSERGWLKGQKWPRTDESESRGSGDDGQWKYREGQRRQTVKTAEGRKQCRAKGQTLQVLVAGRIPGSYQPLKAEGPDTQGLGAVMLAGADCCC
jgi:hypothetical protein